MVAIFTGRDLIVDFEENPNSGADHQYRVEYQCANSAVVHYVANADFRNIDAQGNRQYVDTLTYEENRAAGLTRTPTVRLYTQNANGKWSDPLVVQASNPQPTLPSTPTVTSTVNGVVVNITRPQENDVAGYRIWRSDITPVALIDANLVFDGPDTSPVIALPDSSDYFLVVAPYDSFDMEGLNVSPEISTTAARIDWEIINGTGKQDLLDKVDTIANGLTELGGDVEVIDNDLKDAKAQITGLFNTYGSTENAADSAAAAAQSVIDAAGQASLSVAAKLAAQDASGLSEAAKIIAVQGAVDSGAARDVSTVARDNSVAAKDLAILARNAAIAAEGNASGHADRAFEQAGIATTAKDDAAGFATAALLSRDEAASFSGQAGTFASAASTTLLSAEVAASIVAPSTFQQDGRFFSHLFGDETTAVRPEVVYPTSNYVATELGKVLRFYDPTTGYTAVSLRRRLRRTEHTRRFRLIVRGRQVINPATGTTRLLANLYGLTADYNSIVYDGFTDVQEGSPFAPMTVASGVVSVLLEFSLSPTPVADSAGNVADGGVVVSAVIFNDQDANLSCGTFDLIAIELSDITEEYAARQSAAASLASSASAAAASTAAGEQASVAQDFAGTATTKAGEASFSAGQSATSATGAFNSASAAEDARLSAVAANGTAQTAAGAASGSATVADGHRAAAASSATLSSDFAGIAEDWAENAQGQAGFAQSQASAAAGSATSASESAATATSQAELASGFAGTANTRATAADLSATLADQHRATAASQATLSANFSRAANAFSNTKGITGNGNFETGPELWSGSDMVFARQPEPYGAFWRSNISLRGQLSGPTIAVDVNRRYQLNIRFVVHAVTQRVYFGLNCLDAMGNSLGNVYLPDGANVLYPSGQFYTRSDYLTGQAGTPPAFEIGNFFITGTAKVIPVAFMNYDNASGGFSDVLELWVEDITATHAATTSASVATSSAATATDASSTAVTNAGLSATYRDQSLGHAQTADTHRANASGFASAASGSAGSASGSASSAATQATLAAGHASTALTQAGIANDAAVLATASESAAATSATLSASFSAGAGRAASARSVPSLLANNNYWIFTEGASDMVAYAESVGRRYISTMMPANGLSMVRNRHPIAVSPGMIIRATHEVGNWNTDMPDAIHLSRFAWFVDGVRQLDGGTNGWMAIPTAYARPVHVNEFTVPANCSELYVESYFEGRGPDATRKQFIWWALRLEDVTSEKSALSSANASSNSATVADGHRASAATQAGLSATYRDQALGHANTASNQAGIATSSATTADAHRASAATQASLSATYSREANALSNMVGITTNGKFDSGPELWEANEMAFLREAEPYGALWRSYGPALGSIYGKKTPVTPGRVYRLNTRFVVHSLAQTAYAGFQCYDALDTYLGNIYMPSVANQTFPGGNFYTRQEEFTGEFGTHPVFAGANAFITGTTQIRPLFLTNYANAPAPSYMDVLELWMEDITDVKAAQTAANASASSATSANDQRALAETAAGLSATYRDAALGHAGSASTQAGVATTQAGVATTQAGIATAGAAAASTTSALIARINTGSINANPSMLDWPVGSAYPNIWSVWGGSAPTKITNVLGENSARFTAAIDTESGMVQFGTGGLQDVTAGKYQLDVEAVVQSGNWQGSGILVLWLDGGLNIITSSILNFVTDKDINNQFGVLPIGTTKRYIKTVTAPAGTAKAYVYAMANWSGFGSTMLAKTIDFKKVALKAASAADAGFADLEASVTVAQGAIANLEGAAAYYEIVTAASGSNPATVQLKSGKNGSAVNLIGDSISIKNPVGGQIVEVAKYENGIAQLNNAMIRRLRVAPRSNSQIFLPVMLRPMIRIGSDGQTIQYQNGETFGANPERITPDLNGLPALAVGESYDVKAVNVTAISFQAYAKKITAADPVVQDSGAGTNTGGTPQWRAHKPTALDAYNGNYQFKFQVVGQLVGSEPVSGGGGIYDYRAVGNLYLADTAGNMQLVGSYDENWGGFNASGTRYITATVTNNMAVGQTGNDEFGVHPTLGAISAFDSVMYATQVQSNVTALTSPISWTITPPSPDE